MILELVEKHKPLAKDKPHVLRAWLSMMAFEDLSMFAKSTDVVPEQVIQSLMYRLRDFQSFRITNPEHAKLNLEVSSTQIPVAAPKNVLFMHHSKQLINEYFFILQVTEKILTYLLDCLHNDKERYDSRLLLLRELLVQYCTILYTQYCYFFIGRS